MGTRNKKFSLGRAGFVNGSHLYVQLCVLSLGGCMCDFWYGGGVVFDNPGDQFCACALACACSRMEVEQFEVQMKAEGTLRSRDERRRED